MSARSRGRLLLAGSGEFTAAMAELDYALVGSLAGASGRRPRVAIVPTAAGPEGAAERWAEMGIRHFRSLDADPFALMVLTRADADDPRQLAAAAGADWFYFSGGDPGHVAGALAGTPFWSAVAARFRDGAVIAGCSAGAMMLGESMFVPVRRDPDTGMPRELAIRDGLGVLPGVLVMPHFDAIPIELRERWTATWPEGLRLLAIDEDTAILSGSEGWTVHGSGRALVLHAPGDERTYTAGAVIDERALPLR